MGNALRPPGHIQQLVAEHVYMTLEDVLRLVSLLVDEHNPASQAVL